MIIFFFIVKIVNLSKSFYLLIIFILRSRATISVRFATSNLRNILFKACLTEFSVIHKVLPISTLFTACATTSVI